MKLVVRLFGIVSFFFLILTTVIACSGGGGGTQQNPPQNSPPPPGTHSVSGTITEVTASGSVYNRPAAGVTVHADPGGHTTTTDEQGRYALNVPNGTYTIVPSRGSHVFSLTSRVVIVNGAPVSGVDFTESIPTINEGKIAYVGTGTAGNAALRIWAILANTTSTLLDNPNIQPMNLVPFRGGTSRIAFEPILSGNERNGGIRTIDMGGVQSVIVPDNGFFAPGFASSAVGRVFDTIRDPNTGIEYVVLSSPCAPGQFCVSLQNDVFVVIADVLLEV